MSSQTAKQKATAYREGGRSTSAAGMRTESETSMEVSGTGSAGSTPRAVRAMNLTENEVQAIDSRFLKKAKVIFERVDYDQACKW